MSGFYYHYQHIFDVAVRLYHRGEQSRWPDSHFTKEVIDLARDFTALLAPVVKQNPALLQEDVTILRLSISLSCVVDRYIAYVDEAREWIKQYVWYMRIERFRSKHVCFLHLSVNRF